MIPEIEARNILLTYEGSNNQLLDWKKKFVELKSFKLTRPQAEYVQKYHTVTPKVARKYINIVSTFGEKLADDKLLPSIPENIWCEKLLCESDKAYHIWGKLFEKEQNRKLNRIAFLDFIFADPKKQQKQRSIYQNKFSVVI